MLPQVRSLFLLLRGLYHPRMQRFRHSLSGSESLPGQRSCHVPSAAMPPGCLPPPPFTPPGDATITRVMSETASGGPIWKPRREALIKAAFPCSHPFAWPMHRPFHKVATLKPCSLLCATELHLKHAGCLPTGRSWSSCVRVVLIRRRTRLPQQELTSSCRDRR